VSELGQSTAVRQELASCGFNQRDTTPRRPTRGAAGCAERKVTEAGVSEMWLQRVLRMGAAVVAVVSDVWEAAVSELAVECSQ